MLPDWESRIGKPLAARLRDPGIKAGQQLLALVAHGIALAVNDDLRGIDLTRAHGLRIGLLAQRVLAVGQRVLPPDIVPVVDVERDGDKILALLQVGPDLVGGRAGRAALAREELGEDRLWRRRRRRCGRMKGARRECRAGAQEKMQVGLQHD
jgi:hypothetical protein